MSKIRVGLIVEEYFEKELGGYGGYGMLARNYISKYIPNEQIEVEVFIGRNKNWFKGKEIIREGIKINYIPPKFKKNYFKSKNIDIYLSIETNRMFYEILSVDKKPIILYGQDPRPNSDWEEIKTVPNQTEFEAYLNYYSKWEEKIIKVVHESLQDNRLQLISQGKYLKNKMIDLYKLPENIEINYIPNPMEFKKNPNNEIKDKITFIGRLTDVKRPWIFFELAKKFPEYDFLVCGDIPENKKMISMIDNAKKIKNLIFKGYISGKEKDEILEKTKVLVNTSIHEAIPITFLEAISYGARILSCQNPDNITSDNGRYTGVVLGDGLDKINIFEKMLKEILEEEVSLKMKNENFKRYKNLYSIKNFKNAIRKEILIKE